MAISKNYTLCTHLSGSSEINLKGIYGTRGVSSKDVYPGSRCESISWIDESNQILYLFGGYGYDINKKLGCLNDLWSFSIELNEWKWISGSNVVNRKGLYGIKGVSSKDNYPGSRRGSTSWFDVSNQILYLFGGYGYDVNGNHGYFNDLWLYSIEANEWTCISGSIVHSQKGSYGTKGVSSKDNHPGSRCESISWFDESNQILYLFGGLGYDISGSFGCLNDLWSYSIESNEWTWISGSNEINHKGLYGTKGAPSKYHYPGSRYGSISWFDKSNQILYLFGGEGYDVNSKNYFLNDLWSFSIKTNEWTWISGNDVFNQKGIYGKKRFSSKDNYPGSRSGSISCFDNSNEILYLFGGYGYDIINRENGYLNDLWSFSIKTNEWTWISGNDVFNQKGIYGKKRFSSKDNYPGSRRQCISWFDESKQILYLFGGFGCDASGNDSVFLNDLWSFNFIVNNECNHKAYNGTKSSYSNSFYYLIEKQIDNNEINEEYFYDDEIQIDEKKYKIHKFILSFRCPGLLNYCNDSIKKLDEIGKDLNNKLKKVSNETLSLLLKWIYSGDFMNENISKQSYEQLYFIFKNIITNKPEICDYILYQLNDIINSFDDDEYLKEFKDSLNSMFIQKEIIHLFSSKLPERSNIDDDNRIELFYLIKNKIPDLFNEDINKFSINTELDLIKDYEFDLDLFIKNREYCDISFEFDEKKLDAHKSILSSRLGFLFQSLNINFGENNYIIDNKELTFEAFETLINYIYSHNSLEVRLSENNFKHHLTLYNFLYKNWEKCDKSPIITELYNHLRTLLYDSNIEEPLITEIFKNVFDMKNIEQLRDINLLKHYTSLIIKLSMPIDEFSKEEKWFIGMMIRK